MFANSFGLPLKLIIILLFSWRLWQFGQALKLPYDGQALFFRYQNSQYFKGEKSSYILSDAEVNAVRGFQLVEQNTDLEKMLPGHPPFGSWLFGLSGKFLGQPLWASFVAFLSVLILLRQISLSLIGEIGSKVLLIIFLLEPLVTEQVTTTMLDIFLLALSLIGVYGYLKWTQTAKLSWLLFSQFAVGLGLASKFWVAAFPLAVGLYLATVLTGDFKRFVHHTIALTIAGLGFVVGHWQYFLFHTPWQFLLYQRYLLNWWAGSPRVPGGQVWDLIFNNRWHTWWGKGLVIKVPEWWFGWSAGVVFGLLAAIKLLVKRGLSQIWTSLSIWIVLSLILFTFSATYPRHLLVVLPGLYLLSLRFFFKPSIASTAKRLTL